MCKKIDEVSWIEPEPLVNMSDDYYKGFGHAACQAELLNSKQIPTIEDVEVFKMSNKNIVIEVTKEELMFLVNAVARENLVSWDEDLKLQEKLEKMLEQIEAGFKE